MTSELTLYGAPVNTVFDLLGENDITYSLGWALASSKRLGPVRGRDRPEVRHEHPHGPLLGELRDHLDEHLLATGRSGEDVAFGRTPRDPFVPSTLRTRARRAWRAAGLKPIGLHECRHTFASLLIAAGANAKAVQEAMGHAAISVTFDLYGHLVDGAREELRVRVDAYLEAERRGTTVGQ